MRWRASPGLITTIELTRSLQSVEGRRHWIEPVEPNDLTEQEVDRIPTRRGNSTGSHCPQRLQRRDTKAAKFDGVLELLPTLQEIRLQIAERLMFSRALRSLLLGCIDGER